MWLPWASPDGAVSYLVSRWIFLRLLGLICLVAFVSFWVQARGLIGSGGILPMGQYLQAVQDRFGAGLGDNVEVVAAQATLARARDTYVLALTQYHVARLNYFFALGQTGSFNLQKTSPEKE